MKKLTDGQVLALEALEELSKQRTPVLVKELSKYAGVARPSVYAYFRDLEKLGLATRSNSRGKLGATITPAGQKFAENPKRPLSKEAFPYGILKKAKESAKEKEEDYKKPSNIEEIAKKRALYRVRIKTDGKIVEFFYSRENIPSVVSALSYDNVLPNQTEYIVIEKLLIR